MAFQPQAPFPKSRGDTIRSGDWNDLIGEVQRLDTAKVERAGDTISGSLTVAGVLGVGVREPPRIPLAVNTGAPDDAPLFSLGTLNNEDFLSVFGGRRGNQSPFVAWKRGDLRFGMASSADGQGFVERMRITSAGNVGIGTEDAKATLTVNGNLSVSSYRIKLGLEQNGGGQLVISNTPGDNKIFLKALSTDGTSHASEILLTGRNSEPVPQLSIIANTTRLVGSLAVDSTLTVDNNIGIRQNYLYVSGNKGWSSLTYNAHHNPTNHTWIFPDASRPAVTIEMDDNGEKRRFEVWSTTAGAPTAWVRLLALDCNTGNLYVKGSFIQDLPYGYWRYHWQGIGFAGQEPRQDTSTERTPVGLGSSEEYTERDSLTHFS